MKKIKVPVVVVGKRLHRGLLSCIFGPSFYITIRPTNILEPIAREHRVDSSVYCDLDVGEEILLSFVQTIRGTYEVYRPW